MTSDDHGRGALRSILNAPCGRRLARWRAETRGATAVEFALVAIPFFFLLFALIEVGLILIMNMALANATATVARQFRVGGLMATGVAATTSSGQQIDVADLRTAICNAVSLVPSATCQSQLQVDLRTLTSFQNATAPSPMSGTAFNTASLCFYSGDTGSVVELRTYYLWPLLTPFLLQGLANVTSFTGGSGTTSGQWVMLTDNEIFVNEPSANPSNSGSGC